MNTDREAELLQEIVAEYDVHTVLYAVLKKHDRNAVKLALWNLGLQVSN